MKNVKPLRTGEFSHKKENIYHRDVQRSIKLLDDLKQAVRLHMNSINWNWSTVVFQQSWWSRILLPEDVRMINILTPLNILPLSRRSHSNDSFSPSTKSLSLITVNWIESRTSVTENNTRSSSLYSKKNIQIGIHEYSRIIPMNKLTQFRVIGWDTIIITMGYLDHNQDHHHG